MTPFLRWLALAAALGGLLVAGLMSSLPPASECSTRLEVHWGIAAPFFAVFVLAGACIAAAGGRVERLALFLLSALIMAGYVWGLSQAVPMAIRDEVRCLADQGG